MTNLICLVYLFIIPRFISSQVNLQDMTFHPISIFVENSLLIVLLVKITIKEALNTRYKLIKI